MNFTTDITEQNAYFTISGNYSESKGSVIYNGMTLTKCLKIETATSISFTCDTDSELTLVFNSNFAKKIKIDGVKTAATNGIVKVKVAKGTHTITKGDTTNLFYISVAPLGSQQETTTAAQETTTAAQETTTVGQEESATKGTEQEITTAKTEKTSTAASGEVSDNSTKTGDSSHVMVYVIVLAACVIICVGVIVFSAKKKK